MLSLERYTDLYNRRAAGTLDPQSLADLTLLEQKGRTAPLEAMRQAAPQVQASQQQMPTSSPAPPPPAPPPQFGSSLTNQQSAQPASTPTTGVSQGELADLERKRAHHIAATGRVAPTMTGLPPNLAVAQQEGELLQRTLGAPPAPGAAPPTTSTTTTTPTSTVPPASTTTQPPPAAPVIPTAPSAVAAEPPAPASVTEPRLTPEQLATAQQNYKDIQHEIATEGRADMGARWADRLNLPAAEMPGGQYEGAERFAGATPADVVRGMQEHPIRTPLNVLGAPLNSIAAAVDTAARPFMSGQNAALTGDVAGIAAGLLGAPGMPLTGAYRAAPVIRKLGKVAKTEGRAAAATSSARAATELATPGLKRPVERALLQFQRHVEDAHAAANPAEMRDAFTRAVNVVERQWPGAKFDHVEKIKAILAKMGTMEKTIKGRERLTRAGRKIGGVAGAVALGGMGVQHVVNAIRKK